MVPAFTSLRTRFRVMVSRTSTISRVLSSPSRAMVKVMDVLGGPFILVMASCRLKPKIDSLLMWVI